VLQDARGARPYRCSNGGDSPAIFEENAPSHRPRSLSFSFPSQSVSGRSRLRAAPSIRISEPLREVRGEHGAVPVPISLVEGPTLRVRQLHASMLWETTDMSETPDEILRALADPNAWRSRASSHEAPRGGPMLAAALDLPVKRVRSHLNRLASAGVVRLNEDHTSYRLDGERCGGRPNRWDRHARPGWRWAPFTPTEDSVLRTFFRNGRLTEIPAKRSKRRMVLERIALEFEPGRRYAEKEVNATGRPVLHRSRGAPPGAGRRRVPRPRPRGVLAGRAARWTSSEGVR
jgi:hypothetical protein